MTSFEGLLPPRMPAPPLPERGGPPAIVGAARVRRRHKSQRLAGATSALSLAIVALVAVRPTPTDHEIKMRPDATPTAEPSRTSSPSPTGAAVGDGVGPTGTSAPGPGTSLPTPSVRPTPSTPGEVVIDPDPSPPPPLRRIARVERKTVADDLTQECRLIPGTTEPEDSVCWRYTGPAEAGAGRHTPLTFEYCARYAAVTLRFRNAGEISVQLQQPTTATTMWHSWYESQIEPHEVPLAQGSCLSYVVHWDGLDDGGSSPARATYVIYPSLLAQDAVRFEPGTDDPTVTVT